MPELITPFWKTSDGETVRLYHGDVIKVLKRLPSRSVQCVVTSPPYWGLRQYHAGDEEIGCEKTPEEYVAKMVSVFHEIKRVLRDDGTAWLNIGDSYAGSGKSSTGGEGDKGAISYNNVASGSSPRAGYAQLSSGNLVGIPWRVALALQADGWMLRQDIVWAKKSPMPESVKNRCTKSHEYIFLLTKSMDYYYDNEAIKERSADSSLGRQQRGVSDSHKLLNGAPGQTPHSKDSPRPHDKSREVSVLSNKRSVWSVASQGYPGAHFATYPPKLIEPCILAGTSEYGACVDCGSPWSRIVEEKKLTRYRPNDYVKRTGEDGTGSSCGNTVAGVETKTIGWHPTCECHGRLVKRKVSIIRPLGNVPDGEKKHETHGDLRRSTQRATSEEEEIEVTQLRYESDLPLAEHSVRPCIVLDPFIGSGTTCAVCIDHGRWSWGIDLSAKYLNENAIPRVKGVLLARPALAHLVGERAKKMVVGKAVSLK